MMKDAGQYFAGRNCTPAKMNMEPSYLLRAEGTHSPDLSKEVRATRPRMPIPVAVGAGETATSLASRLARANGYGRLQNLCSDQGISQLELAKGSLAEVRRVADLAGADPEHLIFSTPRLVEPGWFCLSNERIKFTAFTRMGGQICPACIAEDRAVDLRHGAFQRVNRAVFSGGSNS